MVISEYKAKQIRRDVDIRVKYENNFRIYEKRENVTINKSDKRLQEIYHSLRTIDKTKLKANNLLLETVLDITHKKQYSDKQRIENRESTSDSSNNYYIRNSYEMTAKQLLFDANGKIIKKLVTNEKIVPIHLTQPVTNQLVRRETISANIPIQFQRNRVIAERGETHMDVHSKNELKTVLDVISYAEPSVLALSVSSQTNQTSNLMADSNPVLTTDSLISNVEFNETEILENNIEIKELPTVSSHLKIKEIPLIVNQINIKEVKEQMIKTNTISTQVVEAEVPLIVDRIITKRKIPSLIPISVYKTRVLHKL